MSSFGVVLDACALFPASLRDTLLRAARAGLYRLQITDNILEEVYRNLVKKGIPAPSAKRLVDEVKRNFPQFFVVQHNLLIPSMPINEKDRHVLAAALDTLNQHVPKFVDLARRSLDDEDVQFWL